MESPQTTPQQQTNPTLLITKNRIIYSFDPETLSFFNNKISEGESQISKNNLDLNYYINIEKGCLKYIQEKIPENKRKGYKKQFLAFLHENFLSKRFDIRQGLRLQIHTEFYEYLNNITSTEDIKAIIYFDNGYYSHTEPETNDNAKLKQTLKVIKDQIWISGNRHIIESLSNSLNVLKFPGFILYNEKKILKYKIEKILKNELNIPFDLVKIASDNMYIYGKQSFGDFFNEKVNGFDVKFFSLELKKNILFLLVDANREYISYENNKQFFLSNLKKYIFVVGGGGDYDAVYNELLNNINAKDTSEELLKQHLSLIDTKDINVFYFLIMSYSCMLNNLVQFSENENDKTVTISFTPQLICSAREREFLLNLINYFDTSFSLDSICRRINYMLENYIFCDLIKAYTKVLFDENNKKKISLPFNRIYQLLSTVTSSGQTEEAVFNSLTPEQSNIFSTVFDSFITNNSIILPEGETIATSTESKVGSFFSKMKSGVTGIKHKMYSQDVVDQINLSDMNIIPGDPFNISTHICLCIYGIFYPDQSTVPIKNIWNNGTNDKRNVDFYFYNWQNEDNFYKTGITKNVVGFVGNGVKQNKNSKNYDEVSEENMKKMIKNNKKISKIYGKLLAYILASRAIFKFHSISLLGYSLGCNVIKHCGRELEVIKEAGVQVDDIINNIIFIGGATAFKEKSKDKNIFNVQSGKIINCYSPYDSSLRNDYCESSIGLRPFEDIQNENSVLSYIPKVENINYGILKLNQNDYKSEIPNIMSNINHL